MLRRKFFGLFALAPVTVLANPLLYPRKAMTEKQFWETIDNAQGSGGDEEHAERLAARLHQLDAPKVVAFAVTYDSQLRRANKAAVWAAGVLLNGGHGSDDGFMYFRHWLIGQGRSVYSAALSAPDSLARVTVQMVDGRPSAEWETFGATADSVYRSKTQRDLYTDIDRQALRSASHQSEEWDWSRYDDAYMRKNLPKLWSRYGHHKIEFDKRVQVLIQERQERAAKTAVEIAGLGTIKAGVVLGHRSFGAGTIVGVEPNLSGVLVTIKFENSIRQFQINSDTQQLFSRLN